MSKNDIYAECAHIKRSLPDETVDQDLINRIATEFRTLPSFENTSYEHKLVKHYSLQTNELLKCRWDLYKKNIENKVFAPFLFPDVKDLHFYNGAVRFLPSLTITKRPDLKRRVKPGPGVDEKGQLYIPFELFMKRGIIQRDDKSGKKEKGKKVLQEKETEDAKEIKIGGKDAKQQLRGTKNFKDIKHTKTSLKRQMIIDAKKDTIKDSKKDTKEGVNKDAKKDVQNDTIEAVNKDEKEESKK